MLFALLAETSQAVGATAARSAKTRLLADCLQAAAADPERLEVVPLVVAYLAGELRQRRTGLGPAALRGLPPPASDPTLEVLEVDAAFEIMATLAGTGSQAERRRIF